MSGLILPGHVKSTLPTPWEQDVMARVYGNLSTQFPSPVEKYRHAYTHRIVEGGRPWARVKYHDGCPTCNGALQIAFDSEMEARALQLMETDPLGAETHQAREWLANRGKTVVNGEIVEMAPENTP